MNLQTYHVAPPRSSPPPTPPVTRLFKVGSTLVILCLVTIGLYGEAGSNFVRKLCELDVYFKHGGEGPYGVWSEVYKTDTVDYYDRATKIVSPVIPPNNINFVISMLECPEHSIQGVPEDQPTPEMFFDMISMLKYTVCVECEFLVIGGVTYPTTFQALIPGDATECMGPNGEPYDRVKVMAELGIGVKILGSPVGKEQPTSQHIRDSLNADVGFKDLIKLRAFNMTEHEIVVALDYTTLLMQPIEPIIDEFMKADAPIAYSLDYAPPGVPATDTNRGVNTGFMLVKPSKAEFDSIINTYKTTDYDPTNGWDGTGVGGFPGAMGTSGILTHHYKNKNPMILGKCEYNNDYDYHLDANGACRDGSVNCPDCRATPSEKVVVARLNDKECGKPFNCPDNSALDGTLCDDFHKKWFGRRREYEDNHFKGNRKKAKREGNFKKERTLGFCAEAGPKGYEKLIPDADSGPLPIPDPATIPPGQGCSNTCNAGEYMKEDCTCTSDECDACPEGTRCQPKGNGFPALCIDCECGFCNYDKEPCCNFNGVNNCKAASSSKECKLQNGYFPGWPGEGNACAGVEISATAVPNGCGCKPNELTPCTYDANAGSKDDKCFIATSHEILAPTTPVGQSCKACLDDCNKCVDGDGQGDINDMMKCMGKTIGKKGEACRAGCSAFCIH